MISSSNSNSEEDSLCFSSINNSEDTIVAIKNKNNQMTFLQDFIESYLTKLTLFTHLPILKQSSMRNFIKPKKSVSIAVKVDNENDSEEDSKEEIVNHHVSLTTTSTVTKLWVIDNFISYFKPVVNCLSFSQPYYVNNEKFGLRPISELLLRVNDFNFF